MHSSAHTEAGLGGCSSEKRLFSDVSGVGNYRRIVECPELEGTQKGHRVQPLASHRTTQILTVCRYTAALWKATRLPGHHKPSACHWDAFGMQGSELVKIKGLGRKAKTKKNGGKYAPGSTLPENRVEGTPQLLLQLSLAHELRFLLSLSLLHAVVKARLDWRSHAGTVPRYLLIARAACAHACILAQAHRQKPPRKQSRRRSPRLHVRTPVRRRTAGARRAHGCELPDACNEKCRRACNPGHLGIHIKPLPDAQDSLLRQLSSRSLT